MGGKKTYQPENLSIMSAAAKSIPIKLIVGAGKAAPTPPVGPALGAHGIKAIDFCKEFNARTASYHPDTPIPTKIICNPDRTFSFSISSPTTAWLLLQAIGKDKGAAELGKGRGKKQGYLAQLSLKHIYEIAKIKKTDAVLADLPLETVCKSVIGTAKSLGIEVVP